jgi:hypothetical protein
LQSFAASIPAPDESHLESSIASIARAEPLDAPQNATSDIPQSVPSTSRSQQLHNGGQIPTPSRWNETVLSEQNSSERELAMLRFRYQIVPWLDANAPRSTFGPKITTLAAEKSVIMDAIIWVAMRRSKSSSSSTSQDAEQHLIQQLRHRLSLEDSFVSDIGQSLLALGNFFYTCPCDWPNLYSDSTTVRQRYQFFDSQEEPLRTLDRFHFKTGTFVSLEIVLQTAD